MLNLNHPSTAATWLRFRTPHMRNLNHPSMAATWLRFRTPHVHNLDHPRPRPDLVEVLHVAPWQYRAP
jgi:hypothetical protein